MFAGRLAARPSAAAHCLVSSRRFTGSLSYVQRIQLLQAVRENDDRCRDLLAAGQFLPFLKRRPLVGTDPVGPDRGLRDEDYAGSDGGPDVIGDLADRITGPSDRGAYELRWLSYDELRRLLSPVDDSVPQCALLHVSAAGRLRLAISLPDTAELPAVDGARFVDPRAAMFMLPWQQAHTMSHGFAVLQWLRITKFCPSCGAELETRVAGHAKRCPGCRRAQYPLTPPVGIALVTDAADSRALLVRQQRHPPGMYSCIAGFLEPGETLESCVCREVAEEVGVQVSSVRYAASQHWPFDGSSVMVGCYAVTEQTELDIDRDELHDARWFSVEEVHAAYQRTVQNFAARLLKSSTDGMWIPPDGAVAHRLIKAWLAERGLPT